MLSLSAIILPPRVYAACPCNKDLGMFVSAWVLCFLSNHKATLHYSHAHLLHLLLMAQTAMHDSIHLSFALVQVRVR